MKRLEAAGNCRSRRPLGTAVFQNAEVEGQLELLHPTAQDRGADDKSSCGVIIGATVSPFLGPAFLS